ncbi:MAG TPA: hypothetical protein VF549_13495 [Solirubrobacteraceae bacterium]
MGRLARAALFSLLQLAAVLVAFFLPGVAKAAALVLVVAAVPFVFVWGRVQADLAMNPMLDEVERNRWRIAIWSVPGAVALYWLRYVRPRRLPD